MHCERCVLRCRWIALYAVYKPRKYATASIGICPLCALAVGA